MIATNERPFPSPEPGSLIHVAGHHGLVGSAIVRELERKGYGNLLLRRSEELDLRNQAQVEAFFAEQRPEYVFLAAAKVGGILANDRFPGQFIHDNLTIQTNVLHAAMTHGVRRLLFLGSSCIYPRLAPQPIREEHLMTGALERTNSAYAVAKIAGVEMCRAYNRQYGTSFLPVMPTNLYGPGDNFSLESSHVMPALLRKFHLAKLAARGDHAAIERDEARFGPIPEASRSALLAALGRPELARATIWGTGAPRREFLHVDDLANACVHVLFETDCSELLNIGVGEDVSIAELAEIVRRTVGVDAQVVYDNSKPDGTPQKLLDVSKLRALGWRPSIGLAEGVAATYAWYLEQTRAFEL